MTIEKLHTNYSFVSLSVCHFPGAFMDAISSMEFDYVASGHYANIVHSSVEQMDNPSVLELSKDMVPSWDAHHLFLFFPVLFGFIAVLSISRACPKKCFVKFEVYLPYYLFISQLSSCFKWLLMLVFRHKGNFCDHYTHLQSF